MLSIFCPYRGRKTFYDDFIVHYRNAYPTAKIYMLEQADDTAFKRGQLMNTAYNNLATAEIPMENMLFIDVDIRLLYPIDFEGLLAKHKTIVIPFNQLCLCEFQRIGKYMRTNKPSYFLNAPDGGVTLFTSDMFWECNGFSNLYIGWGREDSDFVRRGNITRVPNEMIHLEHARHSEWKSDAFKRNDANFKLVSKKMLDGRLQTTCDWSMVEIKSGIFHCRISNISVINDYVYKNRLIGV